MIHVQHRSCAGRQNRAHNLAPRNNNMRDRDKTPSDSPAHSLAAAAPRSHRGEARKSATPRRASHRRATRRAQQACARRPHWVLVGRRCAGSVLIVRGENCGSILSELDQEFTIKMILREGKRKGRNARRWRWQWDAGHGQELVCVTQTRQPRRVAVGGTRGVATLHPLTCLPHYSPHLLALLTRRVGRWRKEEWIQHVSVSLYPSCARMLARLATQEGKKHTAKIWAWRAGGEREAGWQAGAPTRCSGVGGRAAASCGCVSGEGRPADLSLGQIHSVL